MSTSGAATAAIPEARYQCQCGAIPECDVHAPADRMFWFDQCGDTGYVCEPGWYALDCLREMRDGLEAYADDPEDGPLLTWGPSLAAVMEDRQ